jgi:outer membrane protein assembly factor BamD
MSIKLFKSLAAHWGLALAIVSMFASCASRTDTIPVGTLNPDQFLVDRAEEAGAEGDWLEAREFYQQVVDNYPQSPLRADARLGLADALLAQGSSESLVLAATEYEDFLRFYPTSPRIDEAQFGLAMTHFGQMRAPERDQTETRAALAQFEEFFRSYPDSDLTQDARTRWREARDRLSQNFYSVGYYYYRTNWFPGAISRFEEILDTDPGFTGRDAVYFYLAESLARTGDPEGAVPYLERLLTEFDSSDYLEDANRRLSELTAR